MPKLSMGTRIVSRDDLTIYIHRTANVWACVHGARIGFTHRATRRVLYRPCLLTHPPS